ncbi:MAG: hypothetical protein VX498_13890, partial [Myxococcota bacterium]|nr:hypothetical protein [Myxococcota bacterium]
MFKAPILDFDPDSDAVINPSDLLKVDLPSRAVLCFFWEVVQKHVAEHKLVACAPLKSEMPD